MCIKLNFQIFILAVLFFVSNNVEIYSIMLLFILVHEIAHIITGLVLGFKIFQIRVGILGFKIILKKKDMSSKKFDKLIIPSAGPGINLIMSVVFILIPLTTNIKEILVYSNILLTIINLIPIFPLDGGRILKEILSLKYEKIQVLEIIDKVTYFCIIGITILSSILIILYKNIAIFVGVVFLWGLVLSEYRKNRYRKIVYGVISSYKKRE